MSMRERRDIVALDLHAQTGAFITLVRASGSTYRQPGARILIAETGEFAGTISGGCLEADLLRKAAWKVRDGAAVEHYSTAFDDTAEIPYGLGCGGEVDVLLEPSASSEAAALHEAMAASLNGEEHLVATLLPEDGRTFGRVVVHDSGNVLFASESIATEDVVDLRAFLRRSFHAGEARTAFSHRSVFVEKFAAPQRLVIFGAGDDAKPLVQFAADLGWHVVLVDRRPQFARAERFPAAHHVGNNVQLNSSDAIVLMTHSYEEDRRLLADTLRVAPQYLGLLGARHRSSLLLSEASAASNVSLQRACELVHAPVGLDLGGDGPHAVALSIIAEIQAALHGRPAAMRGMSPEDVEAQLRQHGTAPQLCAMDAQR